MSTVSTEHVLVVPTTLFHELGYVQGFSKDVDRYRGVLLDPANISYRPRSEMEEDPSFKQLIPYVIFRHQDDQGGIHLFQYTRGKGQGESRLHSKKSIGIGGHISSVDATQVDADPYSQGMQRELDEEVQIDTAFDMQCVGMINDDETEVGRVHLGIVHICDVAEPRVAPREKEIAEAGFRTLAELFQELDRFESWSSICLQALFSPSSIDDA
jgi:predicted NUDIX family phosphoesterase